MTKTTLHLVLAASLALVACNNKAPSAPPPPPPPAPTPAHPPRPQVPQVPAPADVAAAPADAKKIEDGIAEKVEKPGTSADHPTDDDMVIADFTGWSPDGKTFAGRSGVNFPLGNKGLPAGWATALKQMTPGETSLFWFSGDKVMKPGMGPPGPYVVRFALTTIEKPIPAPADVAAPPADAKKLPSGVAIKVLKAGTGTVHPKTTDTISVTYTGWTSNGKMFDSSRGKAVTFPLGHLIPGWVQSIPQMVEGESARLWIPPELAYKNNPHGPQGQLCFDIELQKISAGPPGGGLPPGMHLNLAPHPGQPGGAMKTAPAPKPNP